mgnify:CR=1 FL=1
MSIFKGAGVAIVTPMKNNEEVNYDRLEQMIEYQINQGTDCIIIAGTTGESSTLTTEEHAEVIKAAVKFAKHRIPVVAGTGSNCTREAIHLSEEAEKAGVDGLLCVTPYYNKATQGGLIRYYTEIANSVKLPIIMYNVPSRTGCNILPETAAKLYHDVENIVAIKEATGNVAQAAKTMYLTDGKLDLYSGEDGIVVPLMSIGAIGVISVWSNVAPKDVHDMCMAFFDGDTKKAMEIQLKAQPLIEALVSESAESDGHGGRTASFPAHRDDRCQCCKTCGSNEELWDQAGVRGSGTRKARFEKTPEMLVCSVSGVALNKEKRGKTT